MECEHQKPSAEFWCDVCRHPFYASVDAIVCCVDLLEEDRCPKEEK